MEHHFNVIILFLVPEEVMNEASQVVAHRSCEVKSVEWGAIDVRKVNKLIL